MGGNTATSTFGWTPMAIIAAGETIDRCLWAVNFSATFATTAGFPPGSSFTKAGLIMSVPGSTDLPTPISQPDADWIDLVTCPWRGNIAISTGVDWLCFAGIGAPDKEAKAKRTNHSSPDAQLYVSWETWAAFDIQPGFKFSATTSTDAYVLAHP